MSISNFDKSQSNSVFDLIQIFLRNRSVWQLEKKRIWLALALLTGGLLLTLSASLALKTEVEEDAKNEFNLACSEIKNKISARLHTHAQLLRSGSAFVENSEEVTRNEWRNYYASQKIEENIPGIQGVGYSVIIPKNQLALHEKKIQSEGFPQYSVEPKGKREIYTSMIYLYPFSGRNLHAFGYDMFSEPVRRKAMETARDLNIVALSGKITIFQETSKEIQAGALMVAPVYKKRMPLGTVEERRQAVQGWICSPNRMNDMMSKLLGSYEPVKEEHICFEIFDDSSYSRNALLYDSKKITNKYITSPLLFSLRTSVSFNSHQWYLLFTQHESTTSGLDYSKVWYIATGGTSISILLFFLYLLLININIRAYKLAGELTQDLSASEIKYSSMISNISDVICIIDINGIVKYNNPNIERLFGWQVQDIVGTDSWLIIHPDDLERVQKEFFSLLEKDNSVKTAECRLKCKDGSYKPISLTGTNLINDAMINGVLVNYHDITERKKAELELLKLNEDLQTSKIFIEENLDQEHSLVKELTETKKKLEVINSEKDKLFSIIAHDLRSPFQGLLGITELMAENITNFSQKELSDVAREMYSTSKNLFTLLNNLLEWTRMQQGMISFSPTEIVLSELVFQNIELLVKRGEQKGIEIVHEIDQNQIVKADEAMLNSVLRNLLSNAVKFTKQGGKVIVKTGETGNNMIAVSVTDSGIGMPETLSEKLFKVAENVGRKGTDGEPSTGLGLLLCKEFVERHGGKIWVKSENGKGTAFHFTLPAVLQIPPHVIE
ncbi:MAG: CHASE domain-containing protein [Ignavibacteria bacterium]